MAEFLNIPEEIGLNMDTNVLYKVSAGYTFIGMVFGLSYAFLKIKGGGYDYAVPSAKIAGFAISGAALMMIGDFLYESSSKSYPYSNRQDDITIIEQNHEICETLPDVL